MEKVKEILNKSVEKVKALSTKQKVIIAIIIVIVIGVVVVGTISSNSNNTSSNSSSSSTTTSKKLKLTDEMITDIKAKVKKFNSSTETSVLAIAIGESYKSVEITKQDLSDAYTYTIYLKAVGVNKADYLNYKIKYTAVEDKTTSKGYKIEENYDFH